MNRQGHWVRVPSRWRFRRRHRDRRCLPGLEVDDAPRTVDIPETLAQVFATEPKVAETWSRLSYSTQRAHAQAIEGAKTEATRQRRVDKVLAELRDAT